MRKPTPVQETVSYDPQIDGATPGTTASANQQNYTKIAIDSLEIEPLAHLDYPATGIDPEFQHPTSPAPEPLDPTTITMPAKEGFSFQQVTASTLKPVQITATPPKIEEIPGLPQGAVIVDTANPDVPLPSDGSATNGYYQIPAVHEYQETGNFFTDMVNLPYNKVCRAFNTAVDILNVPIHDAQYIGENGWRAYGEAALEANANGFKQLGYSLMEKAQTGMNLLREAPGQVMDFFVFKEPGKILTDSYNYCKKSLTSVDAWDQAIDMALGAAISKKFSDPSAMNNVGVVDDIAVEVAPKSGSAIEAIRARIITNLEDSRLARKSSNIDEFFARSAQVENGYNPDTWIKGSLRQGDTIYSLSPNDNPQFFTTLETLRTSDFKATNTSQMLQVKAHDIYGYRSDVAGYRVSQNFDLMRGSALANPQFGSGGGEQFFIRNFDKYLELISTAGLKR